MIYGILYIILCWRRYYSITTVPELRLFQKTSNIMHCSRLQSDSFRIETNQRSTHDITVTQYNEKVPFYEAVSPSHDALQNRSYNESRSCDVTRFFP